MKLSHSINKFYLIKLDELFDHLTNENFFVDAETFLDMFAQAGNENINSLLEFNVQEARDARMTTPSMTQFIRDKYLARSFINRHDIDYSLNYIDELNRLLCMAASGQCLPMTIYYLFLGANLNARVAGQTPLESSNKYQSIYLFLQVTSSVS